MPRTPLVDSGGYFARADAFALRRAIMLAVGFWLGITATSIVAGVGSAFDSDSVTLLLALQTLEATLLYWVVVAAILYGFGVAVGIDGEPADGLALAAWALVPLLAAEIVTYLSYYALVLLERDPAGTPSEPALWLFVPLTLAACGWAAAIWRGGFQYGLGLERSQATSLALLAAGVCAALLLLPIAVA